MRWQERLDRVEALLGDVEQQAEGLALVARDAEVAEFRRAEYAQVDLLGRLHGSSGRRLAVELAGTDPLEAVLTRVGADWCLLEAGGREWVVRLAAVRSWRGLADQVVPAAARPLTARLGLGSALRGLAEARAETVLHRTDAVTRRGRLLRVGADFVEVLAGGEGGDGTEGRGGAVEVVPFAALAAVRST